MGKRMLDLFCGRFGWSRAFAARGWECVGIDMVEPPEIPEGCIFLKRNILELVALPIGFDFVCASSRREKFSVHGMKHFHPNPPYPTEGIELFNHTRTLCESSGIPYVMENVRPAQVFVGNAAHHCGPFYLWGNAVPPLMPAGIKKNIQHAAGFNKQMSTEAKRICRLADTMLRSGSKSKVRRIHTAQAATIPLELAACVADFADRITERAAVA